MANGANVAIQLNDKFASPADIEDFMAEEQKRLSPEDKQRMAVSLKADRNTPMSVITTVKQALRQANALNINYVADDENVNK
jgi:biopolymer transport protein ExbD